MRNSLAFMPYPMFRLTIPLATGIFLSDILFHGELPVTAFRILLLVSFIPMLMLIKWQRYTFRWLFGGIAFLFLFSLGALLVQHQWERITYEWPSERNVYQGVILASPQEKAKTYLCKMHVDKRISVGNVIPVDRNLLVYILKDSLSEKLQCGDCLRFYARVSRPQRTDIPDEFDYAAYLFRQQISGTAMVFSGYWQQAGVRKPLNLKQQANAWRDRVLEWYRGWGFSGDEFAVLSALTVGYKEELSDELRETYQMAGVSHILALSGMHVAVLWGLLSWILRPLEKKQVLKWIKCILIIALLWGFAFVVGLSASVVRAVAMCMLMTVGQSGGRRAFSLNTLAVAAFFMLLYNPFYLFDVGFQLSFLAVFSILLIYPVLFRCLMIHQPVLRYIWGVAAVSLAAQLGTAPLVIYYFAHFPILFLLANLIVAPLAFLIIYGAVLVFILSPFAIVHIWMVKGLNGLLWLLNHSMQWVEHLPLARSGDVRFSVVQVCLLYLLLFMLLGYQLRRRRKQLVALLFVTNLFVGITCYQTHFYKEEPCLVLARSQIKNYPKAEIWQQDSIYRHKGVTVCLLADNRWQNKTADKLLDVDYIYVCNGYRGKIAPLQKIFRIKKIILDTSLSDYKSDRLKEECKTLGLDYIDISSKGSYRILL